MKFKDLLDNAKKAGEESMKRQKEHKDHKQIKMWKKKNGEKWAKCKCGLIAKADSPIWE